MAPALRFWLSLLGTAGALRAASAFGLFGGLPLVSDALSYAEVAVQLADGTMREPHFWPPGWPFALAPAFALLGATAETARALTVVAGVGAVALVVLLARRTLPDERRARVAGWIAALYPPAVLGAGVPHAHHLTAVGLLALALAVVAFVQDRRAVWGVVVGIALGVTVLVRPSALAFAPLALVAAAVAAWRAPAWRRPVLGAGVLGLLAVAGLVAPVLSYNAARGAGAVVSTNNERNVFLGNNPHTPLYNTHHLGQRPLEELPPDARVYLEGIYAQPDPRRAMTRAALRHIADRPDLALLRTANRARAFWGFDYLGARHLQEQRGLPVPGALAVLAFEAGGYLVLALLVLAGLVLARERLRHGAVLAALVLGYAAPYVLSFSSGTYHFPIAFLLMPVAALGAGVLASKEGRRHALRSRALWISVLVLLAVQAEYAYFTLLYAPASALGQ